MKKIKIFAAAAIFCAATFAGYTTYEQTTMTAEEKLFRANLEALASNDELSSGNNRNPDYREEYGGYYCCINEVLAYCPFIDCDQY